MQDLSSVSELSPAGQAGAGDVFTIATQAADSFLFILLPSPFSGTNPVASALRSDGKLVKADNVWLSKEQKEDRSWEYFINLFDVASTGSYTVAFQDSGAGQNSPVLDPIENKTGREGIELSFTGS